MALESPCNIHQVKRFSEITLSAFYLGGTGTGTGTGMGGDHFRLLIYRLDNVGVETLVLTSDTFVAGPVILTIGDTNNPVIINLELAAVDNYFYRVEIRDYDDPSELTWQLEDEFYLHCFPDELESQNGSDALDATLFTKLLWMLGHNVLLGEFSYPGGYCHGNVRRGYDSLTELEADALLAASDDPGDTGVLFKTEAIRTCEDAGHEELLIDQETSVS